MVDIIILGMDLENLLIGAALGLASCIGFFVLGYYKGRQSVCR